MSESGVNDGERGCVDHLGSQRQSRFCNASSSAARPCTHRRAGEVIPWASQRPDEGFAGSMDACAFGCTCTRALMVGGAPPAKAPHAGLSGSLAPVGPACHTLCPALLYQRGRPCTDGLPRYHGLAAVVMWGNRLTIASYGIWAQLTHGPSHRMLVTHSI